MLRKIILFCLRNNKLKLIRNLCILKLFNFYIIEKIKLNKFKNICIKIIFFPSFFFYFFSLFCLLYIFPQIFWNQI